MTHHHHTVILLLFCLLNNFNLLEARLPTQPSTFNAASPFMAWTFRQTDCQNNRLIPDDIANQVSFKLNQDATCPTRVAGFGTANNAVIGGTVTSISDRNAAIESQVVSTYFSSFQVSNKEWSFGMVLTAANQASCDGMVCVLVEFGNSTGLLNTVSLVGNSFQISLDARSAPDYALLIFVQTTTKTLKFSTGFNATDFFAGRPCLIGFALSISSSTSMQIYTGPLGNVVSNPGSCLTTCPNGQTWIFGPASNFLLGSSRSISTSPGGTVGVLADFHFVAIYNRSLTGLEFTALSSTMPNSVPGAPSSGPFFSITGNLRSKVNLTDTSSYFDFDGNAATMMKILTPPLKGSLFKNNVSISSYPALISATDSLAYQPNSAEFSSFVCSNPALEAYSQFTYQVTDGKGDGSVDCSSTIDASCLNVGPITATICVTEANVAPVVTTAFSSVNVPSQTNTSNAFSLSCSDSNMNPNFKLKSIRILAHNPALGNLFYSPTGDCNGGTLVDVSSQNRDLPISGNSGSISFCYSAFPQTLGTDTFNYVCVDLQNKSSSTSAITVNVQNDALQAGCGTAPFGSSAPCVSFGIEDVGVNVTLKGTDTTTNHLSRLGNRVYRISSLPAIGTLMYNNAPVHLGDQFFADNATGNLGLFYKPSQNFFNAMCMLNMDPPTNLNCPGRVFVDGLGKPFYPAITFDYAMGFLDPTTGLVSFSQTNVGGAQIYVYGVNDGPTALLKTTSPIPKLTVATGYLLSQFPITSNATYFDPYSNMNTTFVGGSTSLAYLDPDGDSYRIGFSIQIVNKTAAVSNPSFKLYPSVTEGTSQLPRFTLFSGRDCLDLVSLNCELTGKAYKSDLNEFLSQLLVTPKGLSHGDAITVTIYDPVSLPGEFDPDVEVTIHAPPSVSVMIGFEFKDPPNGIITPTIMAAVIAATAGSLLFIITLSFCLLGRAKRGEKCPMFMVRYFLCTEVRFREGVRPENLHNMSNLSLEQTTEVLCCSLLTDRICGPISNNPNLARQYSAGPSKEDTVEMALAVPADFSAPIRFYKAKPPSTPNPRRMEEQQKRAQAAVVQEDWVLDWEKHLDEASGKYFYFNIKTGSSSWSPPTGPSAPQQDVKSELK